MPYVLSCAICLVLCLLSCPIASCLTCCRASRASCSLCSPAWRASCPTCSRASRVLHPAWSCASRASYVCVYVFILFPLLVSSGCTTSVTKARCSDQRSFVVSITRGFCQVLWSPFPNLWYFTSRDEISSWQFTGEKTIWYYALHEKMI